MKFTMDETELVEFVKHVNAIITDGHSESYTFRDHPVVAKAVGSAIKERLMSKVQDFRKY